MSEEAGLAYGFVAPDGEHYMWVRMAFGVKGAHVHIINIRLRGQCLIVWILQ